jgi:molybdopterin-biosynthesis enzyme MoeA-like protein
MTVALIIVGDEILSGHTRDVNTLNLAVRFRDLGYELVEVRVVPDDRAAIAGALTDLSTAREGWTPPAFIFMCGGIGPTPDDVTHEAVASALGVPLEMDQDMVEMILGFYNRRRWCCDDGEHRRLNEASLRMARIPRGMRPLKNDRGTAPGLWYPMNGGATTLVVLPGVPGEVEAIFDHSIAGSVMAAKEVLPAVSEVHVPHGESLFAHIIEEVMGAHPRVRIGSYPQQGRKLVILRLKGGEEEVAAARAELTSRLDEAGLL